MAVKDAAAEHHKNIIQLSPTPHCSWAEGWKKEKSSTLKANIKRYDSREKTDPFFCCVSDSWHSLSFQGSELCYAAF